jgi:hypothetical protein
MKKKILIIVAMIICTSIAFSNTIIVDINGGGQFTSIQTAINNASAGDTIKVWPGTYFEQITLNKNIVLMGSGYENTKLTGSFDPTITISAGKLMWFLISSTAGDGVRISGGIITNVVIIGCSKHGIDCTAGSPNVLNSVVLNNVSAGMTVSSSTANLYVQNCIGRGNGQYDYTSGWWNIIVSYSNGNRSSCSAGGQGCINVDPLFSSELDFHISQGSPCWNTGNPSLSDPDGSTSDMGYFGGPDCPIYPTVFEIIITPNGNNINLEAKGRANY